MKVEGSRARTGSLRRRGARGEMAWQGRLPSSLTFIREEQEAWAPHSPDGGFLAFNFLATSQQGQGDRTVSRQDFLYDTSLVQGRVCVGSSLTTPNKKTAQNSWISLLCTPRKGEKERQWGTQGAAQRRSSSPEGTLSMTEQEKGPRDPLPHQTTQAFTLSEKKFQKDTGKHPAGEGKVRKVQGGRAKWRENCERTGDPASPFPGTSVEKNPPAKQEMQVRSLGREDPLEEGMATHSGILAWGISWTEEPGRLQSTGSQKSQTRPND